MNIDDVVLNQLTAQNIVVRNTSNLNIVEIMTLNVVDIARFENTVNMVHLNVMDATISKLSSNEFTGIKITTLALSASYIK